jgi:hypothetical protein
VGHASGGGLAGFAVPWVGERRVLEEGIEGVKESEVPFGVHGGEPGLVRCAVACAQFLLDPLGHPAHQQL